MRGPHVAVRSPKGAVRIVTLRAWEICHRPKGFELVETDLDPNHLIYFLASDNGGGGRWRSQWPAAALLQIGANAKATTGFPGGLEEGDTVVMHRPLLEMSLDVIDMYQQSGVRVLVSEDDDIRSLPDSFDPFVRKRQLEVTPIHDEAIRRADGLIVTTDELARVYGPLAAETWLCPNYMAPWLLDVEADVLEDELIRVGWAGITATHRHDLEWIAPVMRRLTRGALFTTVGDTATPRVIGQTEAEWFPIQNIIERYYRLMARADIGIVPLRPGLPLNESKSWIKALEYMAFGVPVVATDLPEQRKLIEHGVSGFLAHSPKEFVLFVQELVHDHELRHLMAKAARARAEEFVIDRNVECWKEAVT